MDALLYYDRDGNVINLAQWGMLRASDNYHRVAETQVGPYWVSTVWLGIDHNFTSAGDPPIIFETMVFAPNDDSLGGDLDCVRYATEAQARQGHDEMVTLVRATMTSVNEGMQE